MQKRYIVNLTADEREVLTQLTKRARVSGLKRQRALVLTLSLQCLDQRIASLAKLQSILAAWCASRTSAKVTWRFTTANARIKLHRLYPSIP